MSSMNETAATDMILPELGPRLKTFSTLGTSEGCDYSLPPNFRKTCLRLERLVFYALDLPLDSQRLPSSLQHLIIDRVDDWALCIVIDFLEAHHQDFRAQFPHFSRISVRWLRTNGSEPPLDEPSPFPHDTHLLDGNDSTGLGRLKLASRAMDITLTVACQTDVWYGS